MTTRGTRKTSDLAPLEAIPHHILQLRGSRVLLDTDLAALPYAFTEHGALMASSNLFEPPRTEKLPIGFHVRDRRTPYHTTNTLV